MHSPVSKWQNTKQSMSTINTESSLRLNELDDTGTCIGQREMSLVSDTLTNHGFCLLSDMRSETLVRQITTFNDGRTNVLSRTKHILRHMEWRSVCHNQSSFGTSIDISRRTLGRLHTMFFEFRWTYEQFDRNHNTITVKTLTLRVNNYTYDGVYRRTQSHTRRPMQVGVEP
ncbi:unnamed protein product [Schistosoma intercalatum]|nr:unnamed protein product [Schistosoma intercalatum]CAH8511878.1 unnamed protein product [Schistosoma intercalatum]